MADLLEANDERRRETKRDGRVVGWPTWFGLTEQIAWEELFLLSLYQMTQSLPLALLHLTGTKNGVIILIIALYTYSQQYCRVKGDTFRKC